MCANFICEIILLELALGWSFALCFWPPHNNYNQIYKIIINQFTKIKTKEESKLIKKYP